MTPRLVPEWRSVLRRAWSIRLLVLAGVLSGAEVALPLLPSFFAWSPGTFALLSFIATAGAFVARIVAQSNLGDAK